MQASNGMLKSEGDSKAKKEEQSIWPKTNRDEQKKQERIKSQDHVDDFPRCSNQHSIAADVSSERRKLQYYSGINPLIIFPNA